MQKQTITGIRARRHSSLLGAFYVDCFWGEESQLHRFLQMYAVERTKLEARRVGRSAIEQTLPDGSIRVQISVPAAAG